MTDEDNAPHPEAILQEQFSAFTGQIVGALERFSSNLPRLPPRAQKERSNMQPKLTTAIPTALCVRLTS